MVDVARLAGVSHQTVSRVLNNHPNVRQETARRVRAAIAELNYRPNRAARALVTGSGEAPEWTCRVSNFHWLSVMRASLGTFPGKGQGRRHET